MTHFGNSFRPHNRTDKALGLFGDEAQDRAREKLGDPGFLREWHRAAIFSASELAGNAIEVNAEQLMVDLTSSLMVGFLWDDATIIERMPVELDSGSLTTPAGSFILRPGVVRGANLEVWIAGGDAFGAARLVPLSSVARLEQEARDRAAAGVVTGGDISKDVSNALFKPLGHVLGLAAAAAIVYFVVLPILARKGGV